jgi:molybdopterin-biosynthesis enzyme MoeA-like protein
MNPGPKVVVRLVDEKAPFKALANARKLARYFRNLGARRVKVDGVTDTTSLMGQAVMPDVEGVTVAIFTGPPKERDKSTLEAAAKSCAEELNAALHDLANSCGRDDIAFEARALEHEAKALYNRIMRLQSHRRWLADRGLPR